MKRFTAILSGIKVDPMHYDALQKLADKQQTSVSALVRLSIVQLLEKYNIEV